jgi:uncharacterized protein
MTMGIKINDIPPEGLTLELAENLDLFDEGAASTAYTAALSITPAEGGLFHVTGRIQATPRLQCSRCLKEFSHPMEAEVDFDFAPVSALEADRDHEHELAPSELEMEFYEGDEIEPADIVKEHLLLALPMVPLHSVTCKGLCTVCGADLNSMDCGCERDGAGETNAFSVLKNIFKK